MGVEDGADALMINAPMAQRQARARELLKESGYDGRPIVCMHATNIHVMNQTMPVVAQELRHLLAEIRTPIDARDEARDQGKIVALEDRKRRRC